MALQSGGPEWPGCCDGDCFRGVDGRRVSERVAPFRHPGCYGSRNIFILQFRSEDSISHDDIPLAKFQCTLTSSYIRHSNCPFQWDIPSKSVTTLVLYAMSIVSAVVKYYFLLMSHLGMSALNVQHS